MTTYSFLDVHAAISGPGGNFALSATEAGAAEGGISIEPTGDKSTMTTGADSGYMHSLHGDKSGTVTVRLLKTSTINANLQALYNLQTGSATMHGRNTITVRDTARGDSHTCTGVAFSKKPANVYDKVGPALEWVFHAGIIDSQLGSGSPEKG